MTRTEFFSHLEPHLSRRQLLRIQLAYTLSKYWHRSQVRKERDDQGNPVRYFEHVRRVALILIREARCLEPEMIVAALLHDAIEDTRDEDLSPDMIEENFGEDAVVIVKTLSKVPKAGYLERFLLSHDWRPYLIKACDRLDNLRSMQDASPEFVARQVTETVDHYYPLLDRMLVLVPPEYRDGAMHLRDQIKERCVALLSQQNGPPVRP